MTVNGTEIPLSAPMPLLDFLQNRQYDITKIAVEQNGNIIPKARFGEAMLLPEDKIEIVCFVGGG